MPSIKITPKMKKRANESEFENEISTQQTILLQPDLYRQFIETKPDEENLQDFCRRVFSLAYYLIEYGLVNASRDGTFLPFKTKLGKTRRIDFTHDESSHKAHVFFHTYYARGAKSCFFLAVSLVKHLPDDLNLTTPDKILERIEDKLKGQNSQELQADEFIKSLYPLCSPKLAKDMICQLKKDGKIGFRSRMIKGVKRPWIKTPEGKLYRPSHLFLS